MSRKHTLLLLAALPLASIAAANDQTQGHCPPLPGHVVLACSASEHGVFYAASEKDSREMAAAAAEAAITFQHHFGRPAPKGAVIETEHSLDAVMDNQKFAWLEHHGLAFVMPWISPASKKQLMAEHIARTLREKQPEMSESAAQTLAEKSAAQAQGQNAHHGDTLRSALMHELGHMYFIHAFWPGGGSDHPQTPSYGSPAPDWLDEVAAILMEDAAMTENRRRQFIEQLKAPGTERPQLGTFLSATHPMLAQTATMQTASPSGSTIRVISGEEAKKLGQGSLMFYLQARATADFLLEHSNDPALFGSIATTLADQHPQPTFSTWLTQNGPRFGLPTTLTELEQLWQTWLTRQAH